MHIIKLAYVDPCIICSYPILPSLWSSLSSLIVQKYDFWMIRLKWQLERQRFVLEAGYLRETHTHHLSQGIHKMPITHPHDVHQNINLFKMLSRCPGQCGHYLPEAPTLLAALLWDCRILGEAVKLLQVTDCKSPLNGEFLSQLQFCEAIDDQHLWKETTMTNQVTQSYG